MPPNEDLVRRLRSLLDGRPAVTEKRMFGGLAFLLDGKMAVAASGQGGLMVRVDPAEGASLAATTSARPMEMRGRSMTGWLYLEASDVARDEDLAPWVERGLSGARAAIGDAPG
jgi:TfoX/Sxy family transcriptional regulator of competence genes